MTSGRRVQGEPSFHNAAPVVATDEIAFNPCSFVP
jgi:hypothetical protein